MPRRALGPTSSLPLPLQSFCVSSFFTPRCASAAVCRVSCMWEREAVSAYSLWRHRLCTPGTRPISLLQGGGRARSTLAYASSSVVYHSVDGAAARQEARNRTHKPRCAQLRVARCGGRGAEAARALLSACMRGWKMAVAHGGGGGGGGGAHSGRRGRRSGRGKRSASSSRPPPT